MPALVLADTYCSAAGQTPAPWRDWRTEYLAAREAHPPTVDEDGNEDDSTYAAAKGAIDAERIAAASHLVRNGRGVVVGGVALLPPLDVELVGVSDGLGGHEVLSHGLPALCPECGEAVRMLP